MDLTFRTPNSFASQYFLRKPTFWKNEKSLTLALPFGKAKEQNKLYPLLLREKGNTSQQFCPRPTLIQTPHTAT